MSFSSTMIIVNLKIYFKYPSSTLCNLSNIFNELYSFSQLIKGCFHLKKILKRMRSIKFANID